MTVTLKKSDGNAFTGDEANLTNFMTVEAGENITAGDVVFVYMNGHANEGKAYISDSGTADKRRANGIALATTTSGNDVIIQTGGLYVTAALTDKKHYYLGVTGAVSTTVSAVRIGYANGTTELYIDINQDDRAPLGTIRSWLKDHAGTPPGLSAFWRECDGAVINDAESPLNFAGAGETPLLNHANRRMLVGNTTSDNGTDNSFTGGAGNHNHATDDIGYSAGGLTLTQAWNSNNGLHSHYRMDVIWIMKIK